MDVNALTEEILSRASASADSAEVFYESSESRPVEFENNRLKYIATKSGRGVGLRVIRNGRIGFSCTSDFSRLDELVRNAIESAAFGQPARFTFPAACKPAEVKVFDDAVPAFTTRQMTELGQEAIDRILARRPDVQCSAYISADISEERLANTSGLDLAHRSTSSSLHVNALAVGDDGLLWVGDGRSSAALRTDIAPLVQKVISDLDLAAQEASISTGSYPVIFTPDAMGVLLISISQGVNGKLIQKGASPLAGRIGERILDERITIVDDGLIDYAPSSAPHDTEGLASGRTPLLENGVLANYLFDLQTAGMMGARPTGNGLRGYTSQPGPGHNNTIIRPGGTSFDDMCRDIRKGLLVDGVLGAGQSNTLAGEFSVNVALGFLIENGTPVGRVKNCMIFGNVYDLLRDGIAAIGDTPEMKGSLSVPHFCLKDVSVGS